MSRHLHDRLGSSFCRFLNYLCICIVPYLCVILIFRFFRLLTHILFAVIFIHFCAAFVCYLQSINCLIFSNGFPFRLLAYIMEAFGMFDCVVIPRRFVHKHCTDFYLASTDLLWLIHLGSFAIKVLSASLPVWLLSNLISVSFGSDALWGCHFIHRRHPVSFVLLIQALFWKGCDLSSRVFPIWILISGSLLFSVLFFRSIFWSTLIHLHKTYFFILSILSFTAFLSSTII